MKAAGLAVGWNVFQDKNRRRPRGNSGIIWSVGLPSGFTGNNPTWPTVASKGRA